MDRRLTFWSLFNPLEFRANYSATSNNMGLILWPLMGVLLFGTAMRGLGELRPAQAQM